MFLIFFRNLTAVTAFQVKAPMGNNAARTAYQVVSFPKKKRELFRTI